jgi:hypothetical protein
VREYGDFTYAGGVAAAMGFNSGRDAGVAGRRPAPRPALEPGRVARANEKAGAVRVAVGGCDGWPLD